MKDKIINKDENSFYIREGKMDIEFTKYVDGELGVIIESDDARESFIIHEEDVKQLIKWLNEQ